MERTLSESLVDYEMPMLDVLAEMRGAQLTTRHQAAAVEQLADQLLAPASVAIALSDLSPAEHEALEEMQAAGGWMELHRSARRFGEIRPMGAGRLAREKPWLAPANAAEGLWYRGLIFKDFKQTESGLVEVVYIPQDLLPLLTPPAGRPAVVRAELETTSAPAFIRAATDDLIEDMFGLLVHVRNHPVRITAGEKLNASDLAAVNALRVEPAGQDAQALQADDYLAFVFHLSRQAGLLDVSRGYIVVSREPALAWLRATRQDALALLAGLWRDDGEWNDLAHVPGLRLQSTGWKNNPLLARRGVLEYLSACRPNAWYSIDTLIATIKAENPDFQRMGGDYTTWYLEDLAGRSLMGFENWDQVEGALIRYLVTHALFWLGLVDLGLGQASAEPVAFRPAAAMPDFLVRQSVELTQLAPEPTPEVGEESLIRFDEDFGIGLRRRASLFDRYQLARFAAYTGLDSEWVLYRLGPETVAAAHRQGVNADQILAFLSRVSGDKVPQSVAEAVLRWQTAGSAVRLQQVVILSVESAQLLARLQAEPTLQPLLGDVLGPTTVVVPRAHVAAVRQWLQKRGYLAPKEG